MKKYTTLLLLLLPLTTWAGDDSLCATVKIEIKQELTLERQAFDAHMRINNGLTNLELENVEINVIFTNENGDNIQASSDPDNTDALFFIRIDTMDGIDDVTGSGTVAPSTSADIHWLIIPAPGTGGILPSGTLYYVGATLNYSIGGEAETTQITPDYIFVKPQPELTLDYFLPNDVYGDDAFTPEIEAPVPFTLGVRVKNDGYGIAKNLKIESAQPKIIENDQGLLIGFKIIGSTVNNQTVTPSLLIDFGDIEAAHSGMGRWQMITTLSGQFTEFTADFTHADELGGELTSLIKATHTHFLIKDVLVQLPGRDDIPDFLAKEGDIVRVYESHGLDTDVNDQSATSTLQQNGLQIDITTPITAGFLYIKLPDPQNGTKIMTEARRSDGQNIQNVWFSKTRNENNNWEYFINLFDSNSPGQYTITLDTQAETPQAPVLQYIPNRSARENHQISFLLEASDATIPTLSAEPLPNGATFNDIGEGKAIFDWTPIKGQAGEYDITFTASDGELESSQTAKITVLSLTDDTDADGVLDSCELQYFGHLNRDGRGDFDNDGISDLQECLQGTDPTLQIPIHVELTLSVSTDEPAPLEELKVYAFTASESYTSIHSITDVDGVTQFPFSDFDTGEYKFRIDYLGSQFWTETINLPETASLDMIIPHEIIEIQVSTVGIKVYLFSATGSYLGRYAVTDAEGKVTFYLPVSESYTFRADILGGQYWSEVIEIGTGNITIPVGGGILQVQLTESLPDIKLYLFSEAGSYLNLQEVSDANGEATFAVPSGTFKVRADYLGYQWWSEPVTTNTIVEIPIDHTPLNITVTGTGPMEGLKVYLFTPTGSYLNQYELTTETGQATFNLPAKPYKVRVDYLNQQYWSDEFAGNSVDVIIPMAEVEITVGIEGVTLYVFNSTQSYLQINGVTDANGIATFTLPTGDYLFRADFQSNQYWSETSTIIAEILNSFEINTGGGTFAFNVLNLAGVKSYVFNENGSYISVSGTTDDTGLVNFDLSNGVYQFRVDYLGYQFWSESVSIPDVYTAELLIPHQTVTIDVLSEYLTSESLTGVRVYLFTENGSYLNQSQLTDENGQVNFYLPQKAYKVRADYLNEQYWSDPFSWENTGILIQKGLSHINVIGGGENIKVYVFTPEGSYLGLNQTTDTAGVVEFILPQGDYKFRADYQNNQFWSEVSNVSGGTVTDINIDTGGGAFAFTLLKDVDTPMVNVKSYVFNEGGSYLGLSANTDSQGGAEFDLSGGHYKIRVDYLGYQFWTPIYTLPDTSAATFTLDHQDVIINVMSEDVLLNGLKVYLFSSSGSYLGQSGYTDENGQISFTLPDQPYKVRVDYFGGQYWSEVFQSEDVDVLIPHGEIIVHAMQSGEDVVNARVYVFSATGSYLSQYANTDETGRVTFTLPVKEYKFRVDFEGTQYWSEVVDGDVEVNF